MKSAVRTKSLQGLALFSLLLVVSGALIAVLTAQGGSPDILQGVSSDDLAAQGVVIGEPKGDAASVVGQDEAREIALKENPGTVIREVVLADLSVSSANPPIDTLAWAVNFEPKTVFVPRSGPYQPEPTNLGGSYATEYSVTFIDAITGEFLFSLSLSKA
jgi:hypothetical protein